MSTTASPQPRYLTKSRFKLGMDCPAKLFYTKKTKIYADQSLEDSFLAALAEGGFQVGELAKQYFPGGHEVETLDYDEALAQTAKLLQSENVVIYEAALRHKNLFIRADILVKQKSRIDLIEVKAKSYDAQEDGDFLGKRGGVASAWQSYLLDVAFQKYVVMQACPECQVKAWLMLADKTAVCPTDGLNQKFLIAHDGNGRKWAETSTPLTTEELSKRILCQINADAICEKFYKEGVEADVGPTGFVDRIEWLACHYEHDQKIVCRPSPICAHCEFQATPEDEAKGLRSGLKECWKPAFKWTDEDFLRPNVLHIWNFRGKGKLMADSRVAMAEVTEADIKPKPDGKPGISPSERQWLQVEKTQKNDTSVWVDKAGLKAEMSRWKFPLHFIDFETTRVAIPFNKGRHPYELVAFQFSHHIVEKDGRVAHVGQYLNTQRGYFPNYDFVRALKQELEKDGGSIFRYATHENSTLVAIDRQLSDDPSPPKDRTALRQFIRGITDSTKDGADSWNGKRSMIDLWDLVKWFYYAPATNGSNSIKAVLPALLNQSKFLQQKYAKPIYGAGGGIPSLNFKDKVWIQMEGGSVVDPYHQLPKMFTDVSEHDFARLCEENELNNGGAAMTAYARMQFEEMQEVERKEIEAALLRYCELDTLAMVMIYEAWRELCFEP